MHALMTAVLFRMTGLDALELDAEAQPPDREFGKTEQRCSLSLVTPPLLRFNQAIAIEHGMHGAHSRWLKHRELAQQLVTDLSGTPGRVFLLDA